ncbi:MAG: hypothetical protein ACHP65_09115 [Legionellales bacterium]
MLKLKLTSSFVALAVSSTLFAGTMGPIAEVKPALFVTGEGAYTWNGVGRTTINDVSLDKTKNGWGGRIAAGATHYSVDNMSYTGELGWGYYGQSKFHNSDIGLNTTSSIYGMDLLVGANYKYDNFDLFFKVGGMVENVRHHRLANTVNSTPGLSYANYTDTSTTKSAVAPEIKAGGVYNINDQWGVSLAYMYVFGNKANVNISDTVSGSAATGYAVSSTITARSLPVSLSSVMFGLRYSFA